MDLRRFGYREIRTYVILAIACSGRGGCAAHDSAALRKVPPCVLPWYWCRNTSAASSSTAAPRATCRSTTRRPSLLLELHEQGIDATIARVGDPDERDAVLRFIDCFDERRFFTLDGRLDADVLARRRRAGGPPRRAAGGASGGDRGVQPAAAPTASPAICRATTTRSASARWQTLFADLARLGSFRLGLTGGEPLLRKDLLRRPRRRHRRRPAPLSDDQRPAADRGDRPRAGQAAARLAQRQPGGADSGDERRRPRGRDVRRASSTSSPCCAGTRASPWRSPSCAPTPTWCGSAPSWPTASARTRPSSARCTPPASRLHHPELMPSFAQYVAGARTTSPRCTADVRELDPFGPRDARAATQPVIHTADTCGAGQHVCSDLRAGRRQPVQLPRPGLRHRQRPPDAVRGHLADRARHAARCASRRATSAAAAGRGRCGWPGRSMRPTRG